MATGVINKTVIVHGSITKAARITNGTLEVNHIYKINDMVFASARIHTMTDTASTGDYFVISEGFRPKRVVYISGYMYLSGSPQINNGIALGMIPDVSTSGIVHFAYSGSINAHQVGFAGCWSTK